MDPRHPSFPQFATLPTEIRRLIWSFAHEEPLTHYIYFDVVDSNTSTAKVQPRFFPAHHHSLALACYESQQAGREMRTQSQPVNREFDTLYVGLSGHGKQHISQIIPYLAPYSTKRIAICSSIWWWHDRGGLVTHCPDLSELLVLYDRHEAIVFDDEFRWDRTIYETSAYHVSLGRENLLLSQGPEGIWQGLRDWQSSMLLKLGRAIRILEAESTLTHIRTLRRKPVSLESLAPYSRDQNWVQAAGLLSAAWGIN